MKKREIKITEDKYRQGLRDRERLEKIKPHIQKVHKIMSQIKVGQNNKITK